MSRMHGALCVWVLVVFTAVELSAAAKVESGRQRVWMNSGKRAALSSFEGNEGRFLPGTFTAFCSARDVRALALLRDTLWIGTEGGLFSYDIAGEGLAPVTGTASLGVRAIGVDDGGALWVGSDYGVSVRSSDRWRHYTKQSNPVFGRVRCFLPGETKFWIGTYGNGCGYVTKDIITVLTERDSLLDERILSLAEETSQKMFFGTASGLVIGDSLGWKSLRYGARLPLGAVKDMLFDEEENLFLAIAQRGVAIYSFGRVRAFGAGDSLPGSEVNALSLDPTGRVWAAGVSGLSVFSGSDWLPYRLPVRAEKRYRYVSMRHDLEGNCYVGTDEGIVLIISRDAVKLVNLPQTFPEERVERIHSTNGVVWFLSAGGVYSYRGSFVKIPAPPEPYGGEMTDMAVGTAEEVWATSRFGILHYNGRSWEVFDRRQGLPTEYFVSVSGDLQGHLWFRTFDAGLVEYAAGRWITHRRESGLPDNVLQDVTVDGQGTLWVVTSGGDVARYVRGAWERLTIPALAPRIVDTTQAADSLLRIDPAIRFLPDSRRDPATPGTAQRCCLGRDHEGNLLAATPLAVFRLTAAAWQGIEYPAWLRRIEPTAVMGSSRGEIWLGSAGDGILVYRNGEWIRIAAWNGLSDDYVRSLCEDGRGSIWIGTQRGGVTRFTPNGGK